MCPTSINNAQTFIVSGIYRVNSLEFNSIQFIHLLIIFSLLLLSNEQKECVDTYNTTSISILSTYTPPPPTYPPLVLCIVSIL